jgi:alkanesulfonate monooxygenase SsuD/methylene tetrahydromethanopterin reductase-like flavin-dependent oxidoreductase (luciferase family)
VLDAAARVADGWNCPFVAELATRNAELDAACAAAGRDPATLARSVYAIAAVAEAEGEARRRAASAGAMARLFGDVAAHHVLGTPRAAVERLRALAAAGADEVVLHVAGDHGARLATFALLGREVLPVLRAGA